MNLLPEIKIALYRGMLRIRRVQLKIEALYPSGEMKTPIHLCIGQEAVAVGVCAHLEQGDYVSSNHRGHGHYLAKGGDLKKMIAELYGREEGCSKGRGGSMHLIDRSVGHLGGSSIVSGGIPIGTGLGLAIQMQQEQRVSVIFFSDGAADEGGLYESVNFAVLKALPVVFVYENNQFSVCSRVAARQKGRLLFHQSPADHLYTDWVDGNAVVEVYGAAQRAVGRARSGEGPSFIECRTYRLRGHAGPGADASSGYRSSAEISHWATRCPVATFGNQLLSEGVLTEAERATMEREIDSEMDEAFRFARESPWPRKEDLFRYLYQE